MTLYAVLLRVILTTFMTTLSLCRLDVCVMPRGWESFDSGPMSFMAMLYMHERIHNPVMTEFIDALCVAGSPEAGDKPIHGIANLRAEINRRKEQGESVSIELESKCERAEQALENRSTSVANRHLDNFTVEDAAVLRPFYVARNRWHMAVLLMQNPSLMKWRKHRLPRRAPEEEWTVQVKHTVEEAINSANSIAASMRMGSPVQAVPDKVTVV